MSRGIQIILKCLAIILALGMLGTYVWLRQRATSEVVESSTLETGGSAASATNGSTFEPGGNFPQTPSRPDMFDTSKSGKIDATVFSSSKGGILDLDGTVDFGQVVNTITAQEKPSPAAISPGYDGEGPKPGNPTEPVFISGSKSINMPIFNTGDFVRLRNFNWAPINQMKKWQNKIDELIQEAESDAEDSGK